MWALVEVCALQNELTIEPERVLALTHSKLHKNLFINFLTILIMDIQTHMELKTTSFSVIGAGTKAPLSLLMPNPAQRPSSAARNDVLGECPISGTIPSILIVYANCFIGIIHPRWHTIHQNIYLYLFIVRECTLTLKVLVTTIDALGHL